RNIREVTVRVVGTMKTLARTLSLCLAFAPLACVPHEQRHATTTEAPDDKRSPATRAEARESGSGKDKGFGAEPPRMGTNLEDLKPFAAAILKADTVRLYEGLPHQLFERKQLENELSSKQTVTLHGYPFYQEPLELRDADAKRLTALVGDPQSFQQWRGEK